MPMVFIGSFATILAIIKDYWPAFPDLSPISTFSFGLFSLFISFLIPQSVMKHKGIKGVEKQAGLAGVAFFLIMIFPTLSGDGGKITFDLNAFGTGGMIAALLAGLFVGLIMVLFAKLKFISDDSPIPDFVAVWFNTLLPIIVVLLVGWLFTFELRISLYDIVNSIFSPLIQLGSSFWGVRHYLFLRIFFSIFIRHFQLGYLPCSSCHRFASYCTKSS